MHLVTATYDILLVFHCNYFSSLHSFQDIIAYFSKFKEVTRLWTHRFRYWSIMHAPVLLCNNQHTKFLNA